MSDAVETMQGASRPTYFAEFKKGEIGEIKSQLRDALSQREEAVQLETIKRVIAMMTLGFDVSSLAPEMIMVIFLPL